MWQAENPAIRRVDIRVGGAASACRLCGKSDRAA